MEVRCCNQVWLPSRISQLAADGRDANCRKRSLVSAVRVEAAIAPSVAPAALIKLGESVPWQDERTRRAGALSNRPSTCGRAVSRQTRRAREMTKRSQPEKRNDLNARVRRARRGPARRIRVMP